MTPPTPILELLKSVPPGPYFADHHKGTAEDFEAHARSGLATVDTGRAGDWPVAYFCEWPMARVIARLSPEVIRETVEALEAVDRALAGDMNYEHVVLAGEDPANSHCKTPAKVVRSALNRLNGVET
jgi:hypothetical protein